MSQPCASFYMRCLTRTTDLGTWKHLPAYSSCESSIGTVTVVIGSDGCIHARQAEHRWRAVSPAAIPWASSCAVRGQSSSSVPVSHPPQIILPQSVPCLQKGGMPTAVFRVLDLCKCPELRYRPSRRSFGWTVLSTALVPRPSTIGLRVPWRLLPVSAE